MIREKGIKFVEFGDHEEANVGNALIFGSNDKGYSYKNSIFGRIENILNNACYDGGDIIFTPMSNEEIDKLFEQ